jgi:MFS family permease
MFVLKWLYFFCTAASATMTYVSYFYFKKLGLSKEEVGYIASITPFVSLFAIPITLHYAQNLKRTMIICTIAGSVSWLMHLILFPGTYIPQLAIITFLTAATFSSNGSVLDALTFEIANDSYGKQRMYASISWGLSSFLTGYIIDVTNDFNCMFYVFIAFIVPTLIALLFVQKTSRSRPVDEEGDGEQVALVGNDTEISLFQSLVRPRVMTFFLTTAILGMIFTTIQSYLFIYLSITWKASSTLMGLTTPFSILLELPVFFYSDMFLSRMGVKMMTTTCHLLLIIRLLLYIFLPQLIDVAKFQYVILPIELIHGAAFAFSWSAGTKYANEMGGVHKSTYIGIYCSLYNNAGGILGNIVGGYLYESRGYFWLWLICIICLLASLVIFTIQCRLKS